MGFGGQPLKEMHRSGLKPAVGVDAIVSANGDLFEEARAALMAARGSAAAEIIESGRPVGPNEELEMTTFEALETITSRGGHACFMGDRIGTLEVGKAADILLVAVGGVVPRTATESAALILGSASGSAVDTVFVDGQIVKRGGRLVGIDEAEIAAQLAAARSRMQAY